MFRDRGETSATKDRRDRRQPDLQSLLRLADEAGSSGHRERAKSLYRQAINVEPDNATALLSLAIYAQGDRDLVAAREYLARVSRKDPIVAGKALYLEGSIAADENRLVDAMRFFEQSMQAAPDFLPSRQEYFRILALQLRRKDLRDAIDSVADRRELTPEEAAMRLLAGRPIIASQAAIPTLEQFVAADSTDAGSAVALIRYYLSDGNESKAREVLQMVIERGVRSRRLQKLGIVLGSKKQKNSVEDGALLFAPLDLRDVQGEEVWGYFWPQIVNSCSPEVALSIATWRRATDVLSISASHALAKALSQTGRHDEARLEEAATFHLDQIELLAYRMLPPQARRPEKSCHEALELADHLEAVGQIRDAYQWLQFAQRFQNMARQSDPQIVERIRKLEGQQRSFSDVLPEVPAFEPLTLRSRNPRVTDSSEAWSFVDGAEQFGLTFRYHNGQTVYKRILETVGGGPTILDFDRDLWPDVFFAQGQIVAVESGGVQVDRSGDPPEIGQTAGLDLLIDQIYRNCRGELLQNSTHVTGIEGLEHGLAATSGDIDNDGFPDLVVANAGVSRIFVNLGDGTFQDATPPSFLQDRSCASGACLADMDADGYLDLLVGNYVEDWEKGCLNSHGDYATCDPRELTAVPNRIYRNLGDGGFEHVTESAGVSELVGR